MNTRLKPEWTWRLRVVWGSLSYPRRQRLLNVLSLCIDRPNLFEYRGGWRRECLPMIQRYLQRLNVRNSQVSVRQWTGSASGRMAAEATRWVLNVETRFIRAHQPADGFYDFSYVNLPARPS